MTTFRNSVVAHWGFTGDSLVDVVNSLTLTNNGSAAFAAGKRGRCIDLEQGSSQYLDITDNATLSMGDIDFGVSCWVNMESKPAGIVQMGIVNKGVGGASADNEFMLAWDESLDRFFWRVGNGSNSTLMTADVLGAPSLSTWYFLMAWHDSVANTINLEINGVAETPVARTGGSYDSTGDFRIGRLFGSTRLWDGLIDEVTIYKNGFPNAVERAALYDGGNGVDWPFPYRGSRFLLASVF